MLGTAAASIASADTSSTPLKTSNTALSQSELLNLYVCSAQRRKFALWRNFWLKIERNGWIGYSALGWTNPHTKTAQVTFLQRANDPTPPVQMRDVLTTEELTVPEGITLEIKSRLITVEGPRGKLTKNVRHVNMDIQLIKSKDNKVTLAVWQGGRKHVACLRTIKSLITNMITGVTKVRYWTWLSLEGLYGVCMVCRASATRCVRSMRISLSTASLRTMAARSRSETSWARRCGSA